MSYQHFYSRVPARVSLYNKIDGFDTFAQSAGLDGEFVVNELSVVYKDNLDAHDAMRVRRGDIPTVYSHKVLPSGRAVHTATTYLPLDFTGERSSYVAHSLILNDEEKRRTYTGNGSFVFNKDMFLTDISGFEITSPVASPNTEFPEKSYFLRPLFDPRGLTFKYNADMIKNFLYSIVSACLGGGRDVYFRLPFEDMAISDEALGFINSIMSVFPYSLREKISFVTYVSNPDSYKEFKLKCVGSDFAGVEPSRGVFYDFGKGTVTGQPQEYSRHATLAAFLYSLFENKEVRESFHAFVSDIEDHYDTLVPSVKTLSELVFVFWQCSGFYVEESVLPTDDTVRSFFEMYEKYRDGIDEDQRVRAYRCLSRYSKAQRAIPGDIFSRISTLYVNECVSAKAVVLDVLLSLIHAPAMREDIFTFIRNNYEKEIEGVKAVINTNLARVFYGGYLQLQILRFFDVNFASEPEHIRDLIVEKLILGIRTPEVRAHIVSFFDRHYGELNSGNKIKIYNTCIEMIPYCDDLAYMLVGLVNRHIARDGLEVQKLMSTKLCEALDRDIRYGKSAMIPLLMQDIGFCEDICVGYVWTHRIGGEAFINHLASIGAHKRVAKLVRMYKTLPGLTDEDYDTLLSTFTEMEVQILPSTMYDIIHADHAAGSSLPEAQAELVREKLIYPIARKTYYDVFNVGLGKDGIDTLMKYCEGKTVLTDNAEYATVERFVLMVDKCNRQDTEAAFRLALTMPEDRTVQQNISDYLRMCALDTASQGEATIFAYELLMGYLSSRTFRFEPLYSKFKAQREEEYRYDTGVQAKLNPPDRHAASDAMELVLFCIGEINSAGSEYSELLSSKRTGIDMILDDFITSYGVGAWIFLKQKGKNCPDSVFSKAEEIIKDRYTSISSFEDAVDIIFRRK